jgi:hypothetical protein
VLVGRFAVIQGCPRTCVEKLKDPNLYLPSPIKIPSAVLPMLDVAKVTKDLIHVRKF